MRHRRPPRPGRLGPARCRAADGRRDAPPRSGDQPLRSEDGSISVVANGEIYNHEQLRAQLEARGHRFATRSDCEVIVHLYEEHGDDCVRQLNGIFGLAIWDERQRRLLVARDPLGVKPVYWHSAGVKRQAR